MSPFRTVLRMVAGALVLSGITQGAALAQSAFPERPIRIVVGVPPGGPTDIYSRMVGQHLASRWGQSVIVDNRPGAGQTIGADIVARAAGDGYTLFMATQTFAVNPSIFRKLPYDSLRDFVPVTLVVRQPLVMFVNPGVPGKTLADVVAHAKANPGKLNFGSSGPSSSLRFSGELLKSLGGVSIVHVPYKGTGPALAALVSGQVHIVFSGLPAAQPFYSNNRIRPVVVASDRRLEGMPDLPTSAEAGMPGLIAESWFGLLAPAGTPGAVVEKLNAEVVAYLANAEVRERLARLGAFAVGNSSKAFGELIRSEMTRWAKLVKENDIRVD